MTTRSGGFACGLFVIGLHLTVALAMPHAARGEESRQQRAIIKDTVRTVTATVEYSTERVTGKQAMLAPGEFKVPEGFSAGQFRYRWSDPKTGRENDRITATTVYSVTQRRYMSELKDDPNAVLPPGDYKLVVGGLPGAIGTLSYRLTPLADQARPPEQEGERIIEVETWLTKPPYQDYNPKFKATYVVHQGRVTGTIDQLVEAPNYGNGMMVDPMPHKGTFIGQITGNVITGKWDVDILPHKTRIPGGASRPAYDFTDSIKFKYEIRLTLNADGSVSESDKGTGETRRTWGPTAPPELANKTTSDTFNISIPGEDIADPLTGRWKQHPASQAAAAPPKPR